MPKHMRVAVFVLCLTVFFSMLAVVDARAQDEEVIRRTWAEGVKLFEERKYAQAYEKFNQCLAQKPSSKIALELREKAGFAFFVEALSGNERQHGMDIAFVVKKILELAEEQVRIEQADEQRIKDLLDKIKNAPYTEKYAAKEEIASTVGHYVVPYCVDILGDKMDDELRVEIISLLTRMGTDAVLPVIEILDSENSFTRQNAATVLGHIRDERAIPALKKIVEDPREDEHTVKEAKIALRLITGKDSSKLLPANEYYYRLAERYYYDDLSVIQSNYKEWVFWYWNNDKLSFKPVERFEYNEILAEESCYDGLAISDNNDHEGLWTLLTCVYYAQLNEVQSAREVAAELSERGEFPSDKKQILEERRQTLETANVINYSVGRERIYKALRRSLDDRNALVAVSCINALKDLEVSGSLLPDIPKPRYKVNEDGTRVKLPPLPPPVGASLTNALRYPDKRVRYAAAECLVSINRQKPFRYANKVVPALIDALGEWKPRVVLVIEPDKVLMNRTKNILRDLQYMPIGESSGIAGLQRAQKFPTEDLIIVSTELPDLKAYEVIDALRHDPRTMYTPIIVSSPRTKLRSVQSLYSDKSNDVMDEKADRVVFEDKIRAVFETRNAQPDVVVRARKIAREAAVALSEIDLENKNFRPADAIDALVAAAEKRHDDVRIPALNAIGHLGILAESTLDSLVAIFNNRRHSVEARIAAADAIADVLRPEGRFSQSAYMACKEALKESNLGIRKAAAKALGAMNMDASSKFQVAKEQRIHDYVDK